jgi:hypothetical protein
VNRNNFFLFALKKGEKLVIRDAPVIEMDKARPERWNNIDDVFPLERLQEEIESSNCLVGLKIYGIAELYPNAIFSIP